MNMIKLKNTALLLASVAVGSTTIAREIQNFVPKTQNVSSVLANNCTQSTSLEVLHVNNVRTTLRGSGDFWWDGQFAKYEIPAGGGVNSVFAGSIWIGGYTDNNNLKVAAMTYRQGGIDYWPGPLDEKQEILNPVTGTLIPNPNYGQTSIDVCSDYDTHFRVTLEEVNEFYSNCKNGNFQPVENVMDWPGNGINGEISTQLAPFIDLDGDGVYEPEDCEYPAYDLSGTNADCSGDDILFGDETIFWVYNDRGNIHTFSQTESIGLEIQSQAFGFATNDEINDMTFYNYKIVNRSVSRLNRTFFGTWVDSDVGEAFDDFVGCDVARGLGYTYNGDAFDEDGQSPGYGNNPPALGMDFFRGPTADANDGVDNDRDGCVDCTYQVDDNGVTTEVDDDILPEKIIMSKFIYHNNSTNNVNGSPGIASDFYNYLSGHWKTGAQMTYGANGTDASNPTCDFLFPNDTDPAFNTPWTEELAGNTPGDRRFLITAGPFTLEPGAVNSITTGLVWARATSGGPFASVNKMIAADDKAQALFDNCFQVLNGPDAPDVAIESFNRELIITLSNQESSNNYEDKYEEIDPTILSTPDFTVTDNKYKFEGYQIFQVKHESVGASDLYNEDLARLVRSCDVINYRADSDTTVDVENPVSKLVNFEFDADLEAFVPVNRTLNGSLNQGVRHSFSIKEDAFAIGDKRLVNNKTYHYIAVAYGYNEFMPYKSDIGFNGDVYTPNLLGQKLPFKAGRKNIKITSARPHPKTGDLLGNYGTVPQMTRIQGNGSNGKELEFTTESENNIITNFCVGNVTYKEDKGPVNIYVVDPANVVTAPYQFIITPETADTTVVTSKSDWMLIQSPGTADADTVFSDATMGINNEQVIAKWGLAVDVNLNVEQPFISRLGNNGVINSSITHEIETDQWITFFQDTDAPNFGNWIHAGTQRQRLSSAGEADFSYGAYLNVDAVFKDFDRDEPFADPNSIYENVANKGWAPYALVSSKNGMPRWNQTEFLDSEPAGSEYYNYINFVNLPSVKIVFTPNKALWTRVPVIEANDDGVANAARLKPIKGSPSVDKNGDADGSGTGWSWFPGYAIDKTSGVRLNMLFAENSNDPDNNGDDMIFNPTHVVEGDNYTTDFVDNNPVFSGASLGGRHYVYVTNAVYKGDNEKDNLKYDLYNTISDAVAQGNNPKIGDIRDVFEDIVWTSIPMRIEGNEMNESEVAINIDISQPFTSWGNDQAQQDCATLGTVTNNTLPIYEFNTNDLKVSNYVEDQNLDNEIDLVGVVPNPYYGGNAFESDKLDHKVKITNLPENSTVTIYTVDGVLINQIKADNGRDIDWNLKNRFGISIASGVYIIHIKSPTAEKTIKWFGSLRPVDLDTF